MQGIQFKLRSPQRKPWSSIQDDVDSALALAKQTERLLLGVPAGSEEVPANPPSISMYPFAVYVIRSPHGPACLIARGVISWVRSRRGATGSRTSRRGCAGCRGRSPRGTRTRSPSGERGHIAEGLRRLQGQVAAREPDKVSFR